MNTQAKAKMDRPSAHHPRALRLSTNETMDKTRPINAQPQPAQPQQKPPIKLHTAASAAKQSAMTAMTNEAFSFLFCWGCGCGALGCSCSGGVCSIVPLGLCVVCAAVYHLSQFRKRYPIGNHSRRVFFAFLFVENISGRKNSRGASRQCPRLQTGRAPGAVRGCARSTHVGYGKGITIRRGHLLVRSHLSFWRSQSDRMRAAVD